MKMTVCKSKLQHGMSYIPSSKLGIEKQKTLFV